LEIEAREAIFRWDRTRPHGDFATKGSGPRAARPAGKGSLVEIEAKARRNAAILSVLGGLILAALYVAGWFLR
jgi:hypothetical protein